MRTITRIIVTAFALLVVASVVPGIIITSLTSAIVAALVLGILNVLVKPVLVVLTLPITFLTLGLFLLVINAAIFLLAGHLVSGFSVTGWLPALVGSIVVSVMSSIAYKATEEQY